MGLRKEQSVLLFNEGSFIESRIWVGNPFNEESFLGPDNMGEALILLVSSK